MSSSAASPPVATKRYPSLGYESSIEKARRAIAENELSKYEEKKRLQEENEARQRRAKAEVLMDARRKEEEEKLTGEELGGRLLDALKEQVLARIDAQMRDEVKASVEKNRHVWYERFVNMEKAKVSSELKADLEPLVRAQLSLDLMAEVGETLRTDLSPEIEARLLEELTPHVEQQVREELQDTLRSEVVEQLAQENLPEIIRQLKSEHRAEVLESLKQELAPIIEAELRESHGKGSAPANSALSKDSDHESDLQREDEQIKLVPYATMREDRAPLAASGSAGDDDLPGSEHEEMHSDAQRLNGVEYPKLEQSEDIYIHTGSTDEDGHKISDNNDPIDQGMSAVESHETVAGTFETAETSKDFTFDPNVHEIKFSSPAVSESGRKRSLSYVEETPDSHISPNKKTKVLRGQIEEDTALQVRIPVKKVKILTPEDDDEVGNAINGKASTTGVEDAPENGFIDTPETSKWDNLRKGKAEREKADEEVGEDDEEGGEDVDEVGEEEDGQQWKGEKEEQEEMQSYDTESEMSRDLQSDESENESSSSAEEDGVFEEFGDEIDQGAIAPPKQRPEMKRSHHLAEDEVSDEQEYDSYEEEESEAVQFSNTKDTPIELDD